MKRNTLALSITAACGAVFGVAQTARAQPYVVNTFGASLLGNLLTGSQVNNDYIDVDGDGHATRLDGLPDNLTQSLTAVTPTPGFLPSNFIVHQYRSVGSVNGLQELIDWGCQADRAADTNGDLVVTAGERFAGLRAAETGVNGSVCPGMRMDAANPATVNRVQYINAGATTGAWYNNANPGSAPFRSSTDGTYLAQPWQLTGTPSTGGVQNDVAPIDVPVSWGVTTPAIGGSTAWSTRPGAAGYGLSTRNSKNGQGGTGGANFSNQLVTLPAGFSLYSGVPASANSRTIFSTELAFAPILPYANYGTGLQSLKYTELQHLFVTGRLPSGENLMVISRDTGSGTHNGMMNSLGIDPSWGVGENIGTLNSGAANQTLGPTFIPGNKSTSGSLDNTLRNVRLGVGYGGGERFVNNNIRQFAEIIGLENNLGGRTGTPNVRPTIDNIVHNGLIGQARPGGGTNATDGWRIGGKADFATMGDPRATSIAGGGYGFDAADVSPSPMTPSMCNPYAARWVNNISRSVSVYDRLVSPTPPPTSDFSPGEFVGTFVFPFASLDQLPTTAGGGTVYAANAQFNINTQTYCHDTASNPFRVNAANYGAYGNYDPTLNGRVPNRTANVTYSDNTPGSPNVNYLLQDGSFDNGGDLGASMESRNRIAGDFNNDGLRDINDADGMIRAWRQRNGGPAWGAPNGGGKASIELLGDFTGDGNFGRVWNGAAFVPDTMDVRYWADGLGRAVSGPNAGKIDRRAAFTAVDNAFLANGGTGNFFGTTKALGAYVAGDSRADIANALGLTTPGFLPIGADGNDGLSSANDNRIDAYDVDYISRQINTASDRQVNWETNLGEAAMADLSADVTGDRVIDCNDVTEVVTVILGTSINDLNLDGVVNAADAAIATGNLGTVNAVWSQGDVNCDGLVTQSDVDLITGVPGCDSIDYNNDGLFPDTSDIDDFLSVFSGGPCSTGTCADIDFNNDGLFPDTLDIDSLLSVFSGGACL
ncbi:MAG: hypothetical protein U0637_03355 [Phycisphaerales bacterium]